jgi:hypothetical protein
MSRVRGFAAIAPLGGGKILVAGGISYPANSGTPFDPATIGPPGAETSGWTDECEVYDADLDAWFPVDPLPAIAGETVGAYTIAAPGGAFSTGRRVAGLPFNFGDGRAIVVGGLGPTDEASGVVSRPRASVLMFDINRAPGDQWVVLPSVPSGHAAGVTLRTRDGYGFAAIGVDELWSPGSAVTNILDPTTMTWRQGPDCPTNDPATAGPPPFLAPRLDPIFTGAMLHHGVQMYDAQGRILVAGSHAHMGPAYLFPAIFFGAGTTALRVAGILTPGGIPNPGTDPGAPVSPAGDDADLAAFQAFPFSAT